MTSTLVRTAEELRELPADPIWFGLVSLAILVGMLIATFVFGKGRPHA